MSNNNKDESGQIIELKSVRDAKTEEKRRRFERIIFRHSLGSYIVTDENTLSAVELVDVSFEGLSFQLPISSKNRSGIMAGNDYSFRLYFSEDSYLSLTVEVVNTRPCIEESANYIRYGCKLDTTSQSYETYRGFVQFLTQYAATATADVKEMKVSYF